MTKRRMSIQIAVVSTIFVMIGAMAAGQSYGQASTSTQRFSVPFSSVTNNFCSQVSEPIELSGTINIVERVTIDANGGFHILTGHTNFQNVIGVGLDTGTKYVFASAGNTITNFKQNKINDFTAHSVGRLISQGNEINQIASTEVHQIIHPDGTITGEVINFKLECRG